MKAFTSSASVKLRLQFKAGSFATLRFSTGPNGTIHVRDGRTYGTEKRMRANLKTRPSTAKMIKITEAYNGSIYFEEIA